MTRNQMTENQMTRNQVVRDMKNDPAFMEFCRENHLNVEASDPQWQAICSDQNTVVSAGAGTGKTTVLSFRFLRLVAERKAKPSEILTITFTRKATAEMKSRIYILMQEAYKRGFISEEDLKDFSDSTISTVDAFCSDIVRNNSVKLGVSRDFGMLSDEDLILMSDEIVHDMLSEKGYKAVFLLSHFSVSQIKQIFQELSQDCLNISKPIDKDYCLKKLKELLSNSLEELKNKVCRTIDYELDDTGLAEEKKQVFTRIKEIVSNPDSKSAQLLQQNWDMINRQPKAKELRDKIRDCILNQIPTCIAGLEAIEQEDILLEMACDFEKRIYEQKREQGLLTFSDIMQLTLQILTQDLSQRQNYKSAFKYIMIDEFQDNNDDYRKLLYLLSEKPEVKTKDKVPEIKDLQENKIFLVGDQKQSIYRFRGADVSVFKVLTNSLCAEPIELKKNWRSEPQIIHFCNDIFGRIMENPGKEDFEADFSELDTRTNNVDKSHIVILRPTEDSREAEARAVAQFIKEICTENSTYKVEENKAQRNLRYEDIGILVRSSTVQTSFEKALNERQIPFSVTEPKTLMKDAISKDFYSALMCTINPNDKCACASLLKSPFFGIKDSRLKEKTEEGYAGDFINKLSEIIKQKGLTASLTWLWNNAGYRSFVLSSQETRSYSQHFDWLFTLAADMEKEGKTVLDYTDLLRSYFKDEYKKLPQKEVFEEKSSGVKIMTVHKSKGLAFPLVIVAGSNSSLGGGFFKGDSSIKDDCLTMKYCPAKDDKLCNPLLVLEKAQETAMENAETKRVLYVAATRPKHHLIFSASTFKNKDSESKTMFDYLSKALNITDETKDGLVEKNGYELEIITKEATKEESERKREAKQVKLSSPALPQSLVKVPATSLEEEEQGDEKLPTLASDRVIDKHNLSAAFGTRVHALIEESLTGKEAEDFFYPSQLTEEEINILETDAKQLALNFTDNFSAEGKKLYCEKPVVLYLEEENTMVEGRIDLLVVEDRKVTITDFKTDRYKSESKHRCQLELYKKAISGMAQFKDSDIVTNVVYLREKMK